MSVKALCWASQPRGLPSAPSVLLQVMANIADRNHVARAPQSYFAERLNLTTRQTYSNLKKLEAAGLIRTLHGSGRGTGLGREASSYALTVDENIIITKPVRSDVDRPAVMAKTNNHCFYCGHFDDGGRLEVDHVQPRIAGGSSGGSGGRDGGGSGKPGSATICTVTLIVPLIGG